MLRGRQVDGVVLATANASGNTDLLKQWSNGGVGLVMIDRDDHPDVSCDRVVTDDLEVGRLATAHVVSQGRTAVAHITGTRSCGCSACRSIWSGSRTRCVPRFKAGWGMPSPSRSTRRTGPLTG